MKSTVIIRGKRFSFMLHTRVLWILCGLTGLLALLCVANLGLGSVWIAPLDVLKALTGVTEGPNHLIVVQYRMPRMLTAILVGGCLALAGAVLQGLIRNPLCSPDIIGITGGASFASVLFMYVSNGQASLDWMPVAAIAGAAVAAAAVYVFGWKNGMQPQRFVLIGIGIAAALQALTSFILVISPSAVATQSLTWLTGSVYGSSWDTVRAFLPWFSILSGLTLILFRRLNVQELGQEVATGVGSRVQWDRLLLIVLSVALAGAAAAVGGAIGFVGLMAPHIARLLVGPSFGALLPVSLGVGSMILLTADLAGRIVVPSYDVPAGVFTAAVGAPFFIYLLYRSR